MYLFLFAVIPLSYFLFHEFEKRRYVIKGAGFNFFCGSVTSAIYCFIGFLFFNAYRLPKYSFESNFVYFFLYGTVLPVVLCSLLYFLLGKNSWSFKILMLSDVLPAFYAVFLPYRIIAEYEIRDYFVLFVLPAVLVCCFVIFRKAFAFIVLEKAALWKKIVFGIFAFAIFIMSPAIIETLYFVDAPLWLRCLIESFVLLFAVGSIFLFRGDISCSEEKLKEIMTLRADVAAEKKNKVPAEVKTEDEHGEQQEPKTEAPAEEEAINEPEPAAQNDAEPQPAARKKGKKNQKKKK